MYQIADMNLEIKEFITKDRDCLYQFQRMIPFTTTNKIPDISYHIITTDEIVLSKYQKQKSILGKHLYCSDTETMLVEEDLELCPYAIKANQDWNQVDIYITPQSLSYATQRFNDLSMDQLKEWYLFKSIRQNFEFSILPHNGIYMHGVLIEYNGVAIVISAPSQVGKSTHSSLWVEQYGATIINGDNCVIRQEDGNFFAYGLPWCGSSNIFINKKLPLCATVFLEQHTTNEACKLSPDQAFMHYFQRGFFPHWNEHLMTYAADTIADLSQKNLSYQLKCTPDKEAVEVLKKCLNL